VRGMGVLATRRILKGEMVHREAPLLIANSGSTSWNSWEEEVRTLLADLDAEGRQSFWELADSHAEGREKTTLGILRTNGLPVDLEDRSDMIGIYAMLSRFNHSCAHNVNNSWQADIGVEVLHANRDIEPGEELCITYIDLFQTLEARRAELLTVFKFQCGCEACSLMGDEQTRSDFCRHRLGQLREALPQSGPLVERVVAKLSALVDEELGGNPPAKCCACSVGYQVAAALGDPELAKTMAQAAWEHSVVAEGAEAWRSRMLRSNVDDPLGAGAEGVGAMAWGGEGMRAA